MRFTLIIVFSLIIELLARGQTSIIFNNGGYLVMKDSSFIVIDNSSPSAIIENGSNGNIVSEFEYNVVKWKVKNQVGNFKVPFTNYLNVSIPLFINIPSIGNNLNGELNLSTYITDNLNTNYPSSGLPVSDPLSTVDRFWMIDPVNHTDFPVLEFSFTYDDPNEINGLNLIQESGLLAERFNESLSVWEGLYGVNNTVLNNVNSVQKTLNEPTIFWTLISDTTPPSTFNCPNDTLIYSSLTSCSDTVFWNPPIFTDNFGLDTVISNFSPGTIFPIGITQVDYIAFDYAGNSDTCSFLVQVMDTISPSFIACNSNVSVNTDLGQCGAIVSWIEPTPTDNCGIDTLISNYSPGDFFPTGTTQVNYIVVDNSGNSDTCSFVITVNDNEQPSIICPNSITINNDLDSCGAFVNWTAVVTNDNCLVDTLFSNFQPNTYYPIGLSTVIYTVSDINGNQNTCSFDINVNDTQIPLIVNCPSDITAYASDTSCSTNISWTTPVFTDNCSIFSINNAYNPGDLFSVGNTIVTYTVFDINGNQNVCTFNVNVIDTISPVINSVNPAIINSCEGQMVTWIEPIAIDNCGIIQFTSNYNSGSTFPLGTTNVIYTAVDNSGNTSSINFDVTVTSNPNLSLSAFNSEVCFNDNLILEPLNIDTSLNYVWSFTGNTISSNPSLVLNDINYTNSGQYLLSVSNNNGCQIDTTFILNVKSCGVVIPEGVSPNSDGLNDVFYIENLEAYPNSSIIIFNRWGSKVFESDDYQNNWNCKSISNYNVAGDNLPEGTYYYILKLGGDVSNSDFGKVYTGYIYIKR